MDLARFGVFCTAEELAASELPHATIHCLTKGQSIGLTLDAEAGIFSVIAAATVLLLVARNVVTRIRSSPPKSWRLFNQPPDIYLFWLFVADIIAGLGFAFDIQWVSDGKVYTGKTCTTQGTLRQVGEVTVALITLAMAIHTFIALWWRKGLTGRAIPSCAVAAAFLFATLSVIIGIARFHSPDRPYEAPTPYWCWIGPEYVAERLALQYVIIWLNLAVSIVLYTSLFFLGRGNITLNTHIWWKFAIHTQKQESRFDPRTLRAMIAYPFAYSLNVIPLSTVRWIGYSGAKSLPSATFFGVSFLFGLSGVFNVALFFLTREGVLLFGRSAASAHPMAVAAHAPSLTESEPSDAHQPEVPSAMTATTFLPYFARELHAEPFQERDLQGRRLTVGLNDTYDDTESWRHDSQRSQALP